MPLPRLWVPGEGQKQGPTSAQREGGQGLRACEEKPRAGKMGGGGTGHQLLPASPGEVGRGGSVMS